MSLPNRTTLAGKGGAAVRTIGRAVVLMLAIAFLAGVWEARNPADGSGAGSAAPFRTRPLERTRPDGPAPQLVSVRTTRRDGYDRVLFTFRGTMPGYRVQYVRAVRDEADRRLPLPGRAYLAVAFEPAQAHDRAGAPTFQAGTITTNYPDLRQVRFAGDFEGRVSFGVGVAGRGGFRVTELTGPTRVAVDVR
jgi:hypothetical protein